MRRALRYSVACVAVWLGVCAVLLATGCSGKHPPGAAAGVGAPATEPAADASTEAGEMAELVEPPAPPPVQPGEALAYLGRLLNDESRAVIAFTNETESGVMDEYGRKKLAAALPAWWRSVVLDIPGRPTRITIESPNAPRQGPGAADQGAPRRASTAGQASKFFYLPTRSEMGVRIYGKGSAQAKSGLGAPIVTIQIFKHRGVAKTTITDPDEERLSEPVYVLESPEPVEWIERVFAGKL